jgi:hypothetical protein
MMRGFLVINLYKMGTLAALITITARAITPEHVAMVVYSKDRPLQLYAFLESAAAHMTGDYTTHVIYCTSNARYEKAYTAVKKVFKKTNFIKQPTRASFKKLTLNASYNSPGKYIIFGVDDIIIKDKFSLTECVKIIEKTKASSLHLNLGLNITYNYMQNKPAHRPLLRQVAPGVYAWKFTEKSGGFYYPYSLDMALYRKSDIKQALMMLNYNSPNQLEGHWWKHAKLGGTGLCFAESKVLNIPMNLVQTDWKNKNMQLFTAEQLLSKFNQGFKIDIMKPWFKLKNNAPHVSDYKPQFIKR